MIDLLARWASPAWRDDADAWVADVVARVGSRLTGAGDQVRLRFWSTVVRYPTSAGDVWLKECNPGQGFEGPLLAALARAAPGAFPAPLALDTDRCRLLLPDLGRTVADAGRDVDVGDLTAMLQAFAEVQQRLTHRASDLTGAGLPALLPRDVPGYVQRLTDRLARLPARHPQHVDAALAARIRARVPAVRAWAGELDSGGVPASLQHHDLSVSNSVRRPDGSFTWFDVGDAFWSHPFSVLQVPVAMVTGTWPFGPDWADPVAARLRDAYLEPWTRGGRTPTELRRLVEPARRLAQIHRAESWRRLLACVPDHRLGVPTPPAPRLAARRRRTRRGTVTPPPQPSSVSPRRC